MRIKTQFWVQAYLRRCETQGLYGAVVHKGAEEAGAVFVIVNRLDGTALLFEPAPGPAYDEMGDRRFFLAHEEPQAVDALSTRLKNRLEDDPDLWIVEVEDRKGNAFLTTSRD